MPLEVEDRVADELSRPVKGRLAAAVRLDDVDGDAARQMQLALLRAAAERDHRLVLEQDHRVGDRLLRHRRCKRALQRQRLGVRRQPGKLEEIRAQPSWF